jgi:radical SAM protein (TIGR01212 family)
MYLPSVVYSFGSAMQGKFGEKLHKLAINAAFTCPNRDGSKGVGGCTFCNNVSFSPNARRPPTIVEQINAGKAVIRKRTGAKKYLAYFQAYTNTYADVQVLKQSYDAALAQEDVIGICVGTRPDCVPDPVLVLLAEYQQQGYEVWLELGVQSVFDETLQRVNRGHSFADYADAVRRAKKYALQVCAHLIVGLPGETADMSLRSHEVVVETGVNGLKLHPLHVVKGTRLATQWRTGKYEPLTQDAYVELAAEMIRRTPTDIVYHRLTGTAPEKILLAPRWCQHKWPVLNAIHDRLQHDNAYQGCACA